MLRLGRKKYKERRRIRQVVCYKKLSNYRVHSNVKSIGMFKVLYINKNGQEGIWQWSPVQVLQQKPSKSRQSTEKTVAHETEACAEAKVLENWHAYRHGRAQPCPVQNHENMYRQLAWSFKKSPVGVVNSQLLKVLNCSGS